LSVTKYSENARSDSSPPTVIVLIQELDIIEVAAIGQGICVRMMWRSPTLVSFRSVGINARIGAPIDHPGLSDPRIASP
jgi:hypothetical protein